MKTWPDAITTHKNTITWCMSFRDVLLALERAGAPAPDLIGAAHADWATTDGICRIAKSLGGHVALAPYRQVHHDQKLPARASVEALTEVVPQWAAYLNRVRLTDVDVPDEKAEVTDPTDGGLTSADLLGRRARPYWTPK